MPAGLVCNCEPVLLAALPEVPEPLVTPPDCRWPLAVWVDLSLTVLVAESQHLPWAAAEVPGGLWVVGACDCAAANEIPPANNAAAENALSFVSFMTFPFVLGSLAFLPTLRQPVNVGESSGNR